jgi:hypothetical protein
VPGPVLSTAERRFKADLRGISVESRKPIGPAKCFFFFAKSAPFLCKRVWSRAAGDYKPAASDQEGAPDVDCRVDVVWPH